MSWESDNDKVTRQRFLESRFQRNTFDQGIMESCRVPLASTSRGEDVMRGIMSQRPRSAEMRCEHVAIPAEDDMGHLSRRMATDIPLDIDNDLTSPGHVHSFGVREVLSISSLRRSMVHDPSGRVKPGDSKSVLTAGGSSLSNTGAVVVSSQLVSRFIATLICNLAFDKNCKSRDRFVSIDKNQAVRVPAAMPSSSYDLFYRPGYEHEKQDIPQGSSGCGQTSTNGKTTAKVDIHAFNAALSRNEEVRCFVLCIAAYGVKRT